jgi:hypothetical protein
LNIGAEFGSRAYLIAMSFGVLNSYSPPGCMSVEVYDLLEGGVGLEVSCCDREPILQSICIHRHANIITATYLL